MHEVDIIYNLLCFIDTSNRRDMNYNIALVVLQNLEKIPTCSVNELADMCYTSIATISRFCRYFGFENFIKFKHEIKEALLKANKELCFEQKEYDRIMKQPQLLVDKVYDLTIESLKMNQLMNIHDVDRICSRIYEAKKVHFFGYQFSKIVANDIQMKFMKLGKFIYSFTSRGEEDLKYSVVDKDSLAIVLSVSGNSEQIKGMLDFLNQKNCTILLITSNHESPYLDLVDEYYFIEGMESKFTDSSLSGSINFLAALNVIYIRYGMLYQGIGYQG